MSLLSICTAGVLCCALIRPIHAGEIASTITAVRNTVQYNTLFVRISSSYFGRSAAHHTQGKLGTVRNFVGKGTWRTAPRPSSSEGTGGVKSNCSIDAVQLY